MEKYYKIITPSYYKEGDAFQIEWIGIFMPFDIIKGTDTCPPDNGDYKKYKKNNWWVCPKTKRTLCDVQDISYFIKGLEVREFKSLDKAIKFCLNWRKNWLKNELSKKIK